MSSRAFCLSLDASLSGWGVTEGEFDTDMIGRLGRTPERSRFQKLPLTTTARDYALGGQNDFVWDSHQWWPTTRLL